MSEEYGKDQDGNIWKRISGNSSSSGEGTPAGCLFLAIGVPLVLVLCCVCGIGKKFLNGKISDKYLMRTQAESNAHTSVSEKRLTDIQRSWATANIPETYEKYTAIERSVEDVKLQIELMTQDAENDSENLSLLKSTSAYTTATQKLLTYNTELEALKRTILEQRANSLANSVARTTEADKILSVEIDKATIDESEEIFFQGENIEISTSSSLQEESPTEEIPTRTKQTPQNAPLPNSEPGSSQPGADPLPLIRALESGDKKSALELINDIEDLNDARILIAALTSEIASGKTIRYLLDNGGNANAVLPGTQFPPLYFAIAKRKPEFVRILLEAGADPDVLVPINGNPISLKELAKQYDTACSREIFISGK